MDVHMTSDKLLQRIKTLYSSTFDLEENYLVCKPIQAVGADTQRCFALYGHFNVDNSRYVLSKRAKLWEANCQEHLFVDIPGDGERVCSKRLQHLDELLKEVVEPFYVRNGKKYPPENHMYSYITVVIVTEDVPEPEIIKKVRSYRFGKTYKFNIRGYMETRLVLVSTADNTVITNQAGKQLLKAYRNLII